MLELKIASTLDQIEKAWALMYDLYRGIDVVPENSTGVWTYPQNLTSNNLTICGYEEGELVATCSAVVDSENKLPLDVYFPNELDELRAQGRKLMEVGLLGDKREGAKLTKLLKMHATLSGFGFHMGYPDIVLGINPRGIKYYTANGFKLVGEGKSYKSLQDAPVVLMHGSMLDDTPINQFLVPLVKDLMKSYDFETRYKFPPAELRNSLLELFIKNKPVIHDYVTA